MSWRERIGNWIAGAPNADTARHSATVATNPRSAGDVQPYRTVNRDRVLDATIAPPGYRQTWQLHRAREESRDLELRGALWAAYVRFVRIQALGADRARISYDLDRADKARLGPVVERIARDWMRFQRLRGLSGTGQTIHQLAGSVLHHKLVDGDCFLVPRMVERAARVGPASGRCAVRGRPPDRARRRRDRASRRRHRRLQPPHADSCSRTAASRAGSIGDIRDTAARARCCACRPSASRTCATGPAR